MNRLSPFIRLALAGMALLLAVACAAPQPPAGAQIVTVSNREGQLRLEPATAKPGDVYVEIDSRPGITFVSRIADSNDLQSVLPITDADIESLERQGTFMGAYQVGLSVHDQNVFRLGNLPEGKYALMVEEPLSVAVLEVRP